jgi:uncharacterized protein YbaR (Trm112 family)
MRTASRSRRCSFSAHSMGRLDGVSLAAQRRQPTRGRPHPARPRTLPPKRGEAFALRDKVDGDRSIAPGELRCNTCGRGYSVVNGVPRLKEGLAERQPTNVSRTFGFEWRAHHQGESEEDTLLAEPESRTGRRLRTGCGSRMRMFAAQSCQPNPGCTRVRGREWSAARVAAAWCGAQQLVGRLAAERHREGTQRDLQAIALATIRGCLTG